MVSVRLKGRLGNQAFMIAACVSYAIKHNLPYHIPAHTENDIVWPPYFAYLSKGRLPEGAVTAQVITEKSHAYEELPAPNCKHIILDGYFQSYKYFDHCREEILKVFNIPWEPLPEMVSIHQRRGDYLGFVDKHPPCTYEYFEKAVLIMREKGFKKFLVFSDDLDWCKENLCNLAKHEIELIYYEGQSALEDLAMMNCCRHQIIANSTFSWWAHWFNRHEDKVCIAPSVWFGNGNAHLVSKDIYFENCTII